MQKPTQIQCNVEYIVHVSKVWECCKKLTYFGTHLLKRTTFRPTIYRYWSCGV